QVVIMVLKVDLTCHQCYKKVYDEKQNTVTIKVVCCRPEKIVEEIICKGGESIKSIEIKVPENPKPKELEKPKEKPKEQEKPKEKPKESEKPKPTRPASPEPDLVPSPDPDPDPCVTRDPPLAYPPFRTCCQECYGGRSGGPCHYGRGGLPDPPPCYRPKPVPPTPTPAPDPCVSRYPPLTYPSFGTCCQECYEGRGGGPCHYGHLRPPVPTPRCEPKPERPAPPKPVPVPTPTPAPDPCVAKYPPLAYPPFGTCCQECYEGRGGGPCHYGHVSPHVPPPCYQPKPALPAPPKQVPTPAPNPTPAPVAKYPPLAYPGFGTCCQECYEGRGGGPCYGHGDPPVPPPSYQYDGYCGRPAYVNRCDYFSEENSGACSIM
ncbi:hypothetical protein TorRG33x02_246860, partial [Trema orientale]